MKNRIIILILLSFVFSFSQVLAEDDIYYLVDYANNEETVDEFSSYYSAYNYYRNHLDEYDNLAIVYSDKVIMMEYGIVEFKTDDACTFVVEYEDLNSGNTSDINGCYGIDGAYISTVGNGNYVNFMIADAYGQTSIDNVILHPIEALDMRLSSYIVIDGILYHEVKNQLLQDFYSTSISLGPAPDYLEENRYYYSYDGHYFYADFRLMIDDYRNELNTNAINGDRVYYNYYEYLPHRSMTAYSYKEIENYFYDVLSFDRRLQNYYDLNMDNANDAVNQSQYYGELKSFFEYQNIYGANALMMLSVSINESSYAKSLSSFANNNLFGHAAFDSEQERNASAYDTVERSVYSHAKYYISSRYSNHLSAFYNGSFFGNKASGMNVNYSSDPYWGEKAASNYYSLDNTLGLKDYNHYAIGIIDYRSRLSIYNDASLTDIRYTLEDVNDFSMIILEKTDDYYKVQLDSSIDRDNFTYDYSTCVGYVAIQDIDFVINEDKIAENQYFTITIDANGGKILGQDSISFEVKEGQIPYINSIELDGYKWIGYDQELTEAHEDKKYIAQFIKIDSIELINEASTNILKLNEPYDFSNLKLIVNYEDGSNEVIDVNSDMIEEFDTSSSGQKKVLISYHGLGTEYDIEVSSTLNELETNINTLIDKNINTYLSDGSFNSEEVFEIKEGMSELKYIIDFDKLRLLDAMLLESIDANYYIDDGESEVNISGFGLSLPNPTSEKKLFTNTYYAHISDVSSIRNSRLIDVSKAYGFQSVTSFNLSFAYNMQAIENINPVIVQIRIDDMDINSIYSVYRLDEDGDVIKCRSTQSANYVTFLTDEVGDFMILSMDSQNEYDIEDDLENVNATNEDIDIHGIFLNYALLLSLTLMIMILMFNNKRLKLFEERRWKDYKKLLLNAAYVQEEKLKN